MKVLAPIGSHVNVVNTKTKTKIENVFFVSKIQKESGGMAHGEARTEI